MNGMVFATKDTQEDINHVARLTLLSKKQVVQAMSNERRKMKCMGWSTNDLLALGNTPAMMCQLNKVCMLLKDVLKAGSVQPGISEKLHEIKKLLVSPFLVSLLSLTDCNSFHRTLRAVFL
jgi:hypothetical protein